MSGYGPYPTERWWQITGAYADGTAMEPDAFTGTEQVAQNALAAAQTIAPSASLSYWSGTQWVPYYVA